jgi:hypothetical protein
MPGHPNGIGQRSPSGHQPAPYAVGYNDVAGYPGAGYGAGPEAPGYPPAGRHSAGPHDAARYLPPEGYGRDGYGGR